MVRAVCLGLVAGVAGAVAAGPAGAEVGASPNPTSQAVAADAQFLEYAPPPAQPGVVCLVDSGVDLNPDTVGALVGAEARDPAWGTGDGLAQILPPVDGHPSGHGTEMAMLMAAPQNGWGMVGLAPTSVRVYSIRVVPAGQTTFPFGSYSYAITRCLQLRIRDQLAVNVINLSFAGTSTPPPADLADLEDSVDTARQHGLNVVGAAGNDVGNAVSYPAAYPSVLSVGAGDSTPGSAGLLCSFADGERFQVVAPGCNAAVGGIDQAFEDDGTPALGFGTSQAAAVTSAVISAMRAYEPALSVAEAELCLTSSEQGGAIDAARAFSFCGLSSIVQAGIAASSATQEQAGSETGTSVEPSTAASPMSVRKLSEPKVARAHWRAGRLTVRVANRPAGAVMDVRVVLTHGRHQIVVARVESHSSQITLRVRRPTKVVVRYLVPGAANLTSRWHTRVVD